MPLGHLARLKTSFLFILFNCCPLVYPTLTSSCTQYCQEQCVDRNIAFPLNSYELTWSNSTLSSCDFQCHTAACRQGCTDLDETSTCDSKCSSTGDMASCKQGCRAIFDNFVYQIQLLINQVTIDADLDSTQGIQLNWTFDKTLELTLKEVAAANLKWFAQSRSTAVGWRWTSMGAQAFRDSTLFSTVYVPVGDLLSDVWFRLAAVWRDTVITSQSFHQNFPNLPVKPSSPTLSGSIQVTNNSWAVCWHSDRQASAETKPKFRLVLNTRNEGDPLRALETTANCHLLRNLPSDPNCCVLQVEDVSVEGETTPNLRVPVELKRIEERAETKPFLVLTNGSTLIRVNDLNDYAMTIEPTQLAFMLPDERNITALSSLSANELLVGLSDGSIHLLDLSGENSTTIQRELRPADDTPIVQIEVDHVQEGLYFVRDTKGISRCWLRDCHSETRLETGSLQFIQTIALDAWNGNLYYATNNGDSSSTPLFPVTAIDIYTLSITRRLAELPPVQTLQIDDMEQRLIAILRNGSIFSFDLVDKSVRDERDGVELSDSGYHGVRRSYMHTGRLFWLSNKCDGEDTTEDNGEGCLRSEELDELTQKVHLNTYIGGFGPHVRDFVLMHDAQLPVAVLPASSTSLILNSTSGQVTWRPPTYMPYQATSNWRLLEYECLVEDVRSDSVNQVLWSKNLNTTELTFSAEASRSYRAAVRVCFRDGTCSEWTNATNSATTGDQIDRLVVYTKLADNSLNKLTLLGEAFVDEKAPNLLDYLSVYLKEHGLQYLESNALIDFDTQRRFLYCARNGSILRFEADGSSTRLIDFLSTKHFSLMANQAVMFLASSYQISAYRLTSSFQRIVYNCVESACASVVGLASDSTTNTLYYLLKNGNGTVELHSLKFDSDENQSQLLAITDKFPTIKQMVAVGGSRLAILTDDGHVGTCDVRLGNLNLNNPIKDAQFLLLLVGEEKTDQMGAHFKFENGIGFESADQAKLSWLTTPELQNGQALYKVQLFQDGAAGERTVDITLDKVYNLPSTVLKKWCSKQKFDVQVDAITPWTIGTTKRAALIAPTKPPNPPTNLKIYATQQTTVDGARAMIDLFWEAPKEWNGDMLGFLVQCNATGGEEAKTVMIANANVTAHQSLAYFFPTTSGRVSCAVASRNEQQLAGPFSEPLSIDSSELRPLVRLFGIDSTSSLLAIYNWSTVTQTPSANAVDTTKLRRTKRQTDAVLYQSVAYICNELYAVRKEVDSVQPVLVQLDINNVSNVIHKVALNGDFQQINAMTSDWVANRLLFVGNQDLMQISLENLQDQTALTPKQLINLSVGAQDAKQLTFDPFTNTAYLLSKNGSLFSLNLNRKQEENLGLHLDCLKSQTVVAIVGEFIWNKPASPTLYALTWNAMINIDPLSLKCSEVNIDWAQFGDDDSSMKLAPEANGLKSVTSFSVVDKFFVFVTATKLYVHDKTTGPVTQIPILNPPLKQLLAASHSAQPYPERQCFTLPSPSNINFTVKNEDRTGAVVEVFNEASIAPPDKCSNISFPQTQYQLYFRRKDNEKIKNLQSVQRITHVENGILDKETNYDVYLSWFNRYYVPTAVSEIKHLRTGYGYPTAPQDPQAFALTPDTVLLYWKLPQTLNAPAAEIKYKIKQSNPNQLQPVPIGAKQFLNGNFSYDFSDIVGCLQNPCQAKIPNLRPSTDYQFLIVALHIQRINPQLLEDNAAISTETKVRTKDIPGTLRMETTTSDSLLLRFASLQPETAPREVYVRYRESILNHQAAVETTWIQAPNSTFDPLANAQVNLTIMELRSATSYDYQFVAYYGGTYQFDKENKTFAENYYQGVQQARTKAGAPTQPEDVKLVLEGEDWYLRWKKPSDNGGLPLTSYAIDYRKNSTTNWTIAELGLPVDQPLRWHIDKKLVDDLKLMEFRVKADNAEGFGTYGYSELQHDPSEQRMNHDPLLWLLAGVAFICFLLTTACMALFLIAKTRRQKRKQRRLEINKPIDLEQLGQIQYYQSDELPLEIQNEIRNLPKIPRRNLIIEQELGKGSFGIVSKGTVQDWEPLGQKSVTVAIKQMKGCQKGQGRSYFLKEAVVMNNFDHPNIIRLVGVCLDDLTDQLLIMEYMSGGDLHAFLRACRGGSRAAPSIRMGDLISMMVDVCRAAAYLEANKHVHRDLAARNCLISSRMSPNRVTKISDFGMAREIYQSDYYRLNGEDLLPLRWLSPEAAHDGLFTSKSDVWAYGVLIFEIVTLGEKPYSSFDNSLVLHKLKNGQNPGRPSGCPEEINQILEQTWIKETKERSSFGQILPQLEKLRGRPELQAIDPLARREFISYENGGFDNSTGSNSSRSETAHFNKSDTRSRGHQIPQSMRRRSHMLDSDSYRADSIASAETFVTSTGDYETPRSASLHGVTNYPVGPRYLDAASLGGYPSFGSASTQQRPFFYNNDAFQHERDFNGSGSLVGDNAYEMLNQSAPSGYRHRPPPLANIPSAPNLHPPLVTPPAVQDPYSADSPTRKKLVSRV